MKNKKNKKDYTRLNDTVFVNPILEFLSPQLVVELERFVNPRGVIQKNMAAKRIVEIMNRRAK